MAQPSDKRAEARFKQLCCLGIGVGAVMPALFRELRDIIPSFGSGLFLADEHGELADIYDENPDAQKIMPLYYAEYHTHPDRVARAYGAEGFSHAMRSGGPAIIDTQGAIHMDLEEFRRSELYNLVLRPVGYDSFIRLIVRSHGKGLGALFLHRSLAERPFTAADQRRLATLGPFLAHAIEDKSDDQQTILVEGHRNGLIILDTTCRVLYSSAEGRRLLTLASHPTDGTGRKFRDPRVVELPRALVHLCNDLMGVFSGDTAANAPAREHQNIWGRFHLAAHWLDSPEGEGRLIAVTIRLDEPLAVRLTRGASFLSLTKRQTEVAVMLASGMSLENVAARLDISAHTAVAHGRSIYEKLDVHNRSELVQKLLASETTLLRAS